MKEKKKTSVARSFTAYVKLYFTGFIIGSADVVPGVSGGTMAFILGIYQELLESIKTMTSPQTLRLIFTFKMKKAIKTLPWAFLLALGSGVLSAILLLSSHIKYMLDHHPVIIWAFFFGLVLASILTVCGRVKKWTPGCILAAVWGGVGGWIIVGLSMRHNPPDGLWYIMVCGAIAICAMILPGISGSFILLLMGKYDTVLGAVHHLKSGDALWTNLTILGVFIAGIVVGISSFVRLLSWLFQKFHDLTIAVLIGFMAGSLRKVWPWKDPEGLDNIFPEQFDRNFVLAVVLALFGFLLVIVLEWLAVRLERKTARLEE